MIDRLPRMNDASWALSALLAVGFLLAAGGSSGALRLGWFVLAVGMVAVTVVRFKAARRPPE